MDHSARVMQVITWNRSFKGIPQPENVKNELDDEEWETHATILDKLLAWEKKLCHEVKVKYVYLNHYFRTYTVSIVSLKKHAFFNLFSPTTKKKNIHIVICWFLINFSL